MSGGEEEEDEEEEEEEEEEEKEEGIQQVSDCPAACWLVCYRFYSGLPAVLSCARTHTHTHTHTHTLTHVRVHAQPPLVHLSQELEIIHRNFQMSWKEK